MNIKASLVITVLNEEQTIDRLLLSIFNQTRLPDEIVIVDGGSRDGTVTKVKNSTLRLPFDSFEFAQDKFAQGRRSGQELKIFIRPGNRAQGRNYGISQAKNDIIAITDAGCELDKNWFKNITKPFTDPTVDVASGYYSYKANSIFQKCLVPYVLVMPDKLNAKEFLPSTRSMAIRKSVWNEAGGFPKEYPLNEDYVFALRLRKMRKRFHFAKNAIVYWLPRENLKKSFLMFYYFAKGDIQAGIIRPKVVFIFARYIIGAGIITASSANFLLFIYFFWAIMKNYRYVNDLRAVFILPVLQITADIAVMMGSMTGFMRRK